MVQNPPRPQTSFPATAPTAYPVFYRTYSRQNEAGERESWQQVCDRTLQGLQEVGHLTAAEVALLREMQQALKALPSGRWLWVGGTDWVRQPENFSGAYNCTSTNVVDWDSFGLMMDLAMQGCGTGAILEQKYISQLPPICNRLEVTVIGQIGQTPKEARQEQTTVILTGQTCHIKVGDSRQGWVKSYQTLLELASNPQLGGLVQVTIDISDVRPTGERLKGFGGVANPVKLPDLYHRCAALLNAAVGRQLTSVECCLLIDEAAVVVVAGNVRRCLPEDALVHTSKGLIPIKDIQVGDWVQTPLGFRQVTQKFDQGYQEAYEVITNGPLLRATLNHRIATLADVSGGIHWKFVNALNPGDRLLHNTQVLPGTVTHLPSDLTDSRPRGSHTSQAITIPELTADVAWLIGFTHGDGYVSLGRNKYNKPFGSICWVYNSLDSKLAQQIHTKINCALTLFGVQARQECVEGENTLRSRVTSIRLAEYFHRYIKQPKQPLEVPSFILQGTVEVRCAYLAGLVDSDGSACGRPPYLLTTVYPKFARQVSALLSSLGIATRIGVTLSQKEHWQLKYHLKLPAFKARYNSLIAPYSLKGKIHQGQEAHGFTIPATMMRETYTYSQMREMGFEGSRSVDTNYKRYIAEAEVSLDIPVTVKELGSYDYVQTYDIEVEDAHCFYCDGYLMHNSAGMRQGASEDEAFAQAKQNLWQQDEQGNWRIDPKRDALRMANHTRVFHTKPSLEECTNAVRSQFYSGEGAIQWAGEAIARANADLLTTADLKQAFLRAYENQQGEAFLRQLLPTIDQRELAHRLGRYGLNPCVTSDTWVLTEAGPRQVKDLIGQQHGTYVNGELFSTTAAGFFLSGIQPVLKLTTREGYTLRLTANHRLLKVTAQTPKRQYTEWVEAGQLHAGDRLLLHNHRDLTPWGGKGTWEEGRYAAQALYQVAIGSTAVQTQAAGCFTGIKHRQNDWIAVLPHSLEKNFRLITIEEGSYAFYCGFLREIFVTTQLTSIPRLHVTLGDRQLASLIQRMLLRLGIVSVVAESSLVIQGDNLTTLARVLELGAIAHNDSLPPERFTVVVESITPDGIEPVYDCTVPGPNCFDANGFVAHNCGEIIGADFHCNLAEIHLNQIDPADTITQEKAFKAGAVSVAALLNHRFVVDRYQYSRAIDPIVGVSFTGLFDFCVHAFGVPWLEWWAAGRPDTPQGREFKAQEAAFLQHWRQIVHETVWEYCDRHGLKRPNRCTTVQPSGTKSLLTGASPGWHPPKAQRFIRRITFRKGDPVAMACYDFGYNIIPSQSDKDETGKLLDDPFDPRCTEWLVEIPVAVSWADLPGADTIDISQFSALAQFDFYMQVQQHYTTHNTSATIELREPEVEPLATAIYTAIQQDQGYISAALLARFDAHETFPRLPFEPISKERYEQEVAAVARRKRIHDFHEALSRYTQPLMEAGPAGCDSDKCLMS
ncbi:ribonucleoside-triphosphate reductase, adenosylcobalamin-dependent [Thermosynechococcus sp. QS41]|uniref:ribonucleoside-triphosphate reductase, adenosylcobalamin-dependent n=1 Tax=Thermosynechococcus sp. QS41 TaxID=3074101 RepID=UPI0028773B17|nr:ribonucleoside-triphosphate reductase, adenosylcobalamin-dependent [Thermosynechococcus sp. QS41]WNC60969.1 ribonucleoside-triphosphate reductase, adenosylcobalamin-dependent [Thermosynechococcus sp. QS41]